MLHTLLCLTLVHLFYRGLSLLRGNVSGYRLTGFHTAQYFPRYYNVLVWMWGSVATEANKDTPWFWGIAQFTPQALYIALSCCDYAMPDSCCKFQNIPWCFIKQYWIMRKRMCFPSQLTTTKYFGRTNTWGLTKIREGNVIAAWRTNGKWSRKNFNRM